LLLDNGFRSQCCHAALRIGFKKVKTTNLKVKIWICTRCKKRDVLIVKYSKNGGLESSEEKVEHKFAIDEE
jgi:hypothetical protein